MLGRCGGKLPRLRVVDQAPGQQRHGGGDGVTVLDKGVAKVQVAADEALGAGSVIGKEGAAAPRNAVVRRQRA